MRLFLTIALGIAFGVALIPLARWTLDWTRQIGAAVFAVAVGFLVAIAARVWTLTGTSARQVQNVPVWLWLAVFSICCGYATTRGVDRGGAIPLDDVSFRAMLVATTLTFAIYFFGAYAFWLLAKHLRARAKKS